MNHLSRHLRPLLISAVALLLTAGLAFASNPTDVGSGNKTGSEASGKTVPTVVADQVDPDKATEADEDATTDETGEVEKATETTQTTDATTDSADHCLADPTKATVGDIAAVNHGAVVCGAAQMATPDGYANHGAFVSEWAKKNHGADASAKGAAQSAAKAGKHGAPTSTTTTP